jgi:uncharacterized phosphosugar-binding protein
MQTLSGFTQELRRAGRNTSSIVLDAATGAADREPPVHPNGNMRSAAVVNESLVARHRKRNPLL